MENVVPGALQRLRSADIFRMAGLAAATLGQEYSRSGAVRSTQRQGARVSGVVHLSHPQGGTTSTVETEQYPVEVEVQSVTSWSYTCSCGAQTTTLCPHASALLYHWIMQPSSFNTMPESIETVRDQPVPLRNVKPAGPAVALNRSAVVQRSTVPPGSLLEILSTLSLSDLRGIAREYDVATNGLSKQQFAETLLEALQQPETVRRVAATLEKAPRQLLAALTLAGGAVSDEELRGLFERFSLGLANQLQGVLLILQSKAMLFRTSMNSAAQQRSGLSGALLDVGWFVPLEVQNALRVSVPITPYVFPVTDDQHASAVVHDADPYQILADILLVARTLDTEVSTVAAAWWPRPGTTTRINGRTQEPHAAPRSAGMLTSSDGSCPLPLPVDLPSTNLLSALQARLPRSESYLRFLVRLLLLSDIVYRDDTESQQLHVLPAVASLLLGATHTSTLRDLFEIWRRQASYVELFELQEEGLRVRCRATALHVPIMRPGELDTENSEARQALLTLLAQAPLHQWISFPAFSLFAYRMNPLFLQKRQRLFSTPHWWIEQEVGRPLRPTQRNEWLKAEGAYLARLLKGPLHWWGACDVVLSPDGRLLAFRLNNLASSLLVGHEQAEAARYDEQGDGATAQGIAIEADELRILCSVRNWHVIEVLEHFAEATGVNESSLCYRLTPEALSKALHHGLVPDQLLVLLRSLKVEGKQNELAAMIAQIERWCTSYGRFRVYTGVTLIEAADTLIMRELAATTSVEEQVVRSIQPTMLILKRAGAERVVEELKRRGQAPLLHDEELYGAD